MRLRGQAVCCVAPSRKVSAARHPPGPRGPRGCPPRQRCPPLPPFPAGSGRALTHAAGLVAGPLVVLLARDDPLPHQLEGRLALEGERVPVQETAARPLPVGGHAGVPAAPLLHLCKWERQGHRHTHTRIGLSNSEKAQVVRVCGTQHGARRPFRKGTRVTQH